MVNLQLTIASIVLGTEKSRTKSFCRATDKDFTEHPNREGLVLHKACFACGDNADVTTLSLERNVRPVTNPAMRDCPKCVWQESKWAIFLASSPHHSCEEKMLHKLEKCARTRHKW